MEIVNYKRLVQRTEQKIYHDKTVSDVNKAHLRRFFFSYGAGEARKSIFLNRIYPFLKKFDNALEVERDELNAWFMNQKERYSIASLATSAQVICQFAEWLNNGKLPNAYIDIKKTPGRRTRRKLSPQSMISWTDALDMIKLTSSLQLRAVTTVQLDGGFRPAEFISLRYGDIQLKGRFCVAHVQNGKTGARHVVLTRSTTYLLAWLEAHPTKRHDDPLWVNESDLLRSNEVKAYKYPALQKRLKNLGKSASIKKPLDFYNFRHSSCALDKKSNLPADLAAERHGHSVKYYIEVYGRLDVSETVNRFEQHLGLTPSHENAPSTAPPQLMVRQHQSSDEIGNQAIAYAMEQKVRLLQEEIQRLTSNQPTNQFNHRETVPYLN